MDGFTELAQERIGWYVYLLRDPRDGKVFYIGKGRANRAFAHSASATAVQDHPDLQSAKAERIQAIATAGHHVQVDILRRGIESSPEAFEVESAAIDLANLLAPGTLLNVGARDHHVERGLQPAEEVEIALAAKKAPDIGMPVLLVSLNRLWRPGLSDSELRNITGFWWAAKDKKRRSACQYVFGVHNGIVRTVYKPSNWRHRVQGDTNWEEDIGKKPRWGFDAEDAPEMAHYLNRLCATCSPSSGPTATSSPPSLTPEWREPGPTPDRAAVLTRIRPHPPRFWWLVVGDRD